MDTIFYQRTQYEKSIVSLLCVFLALILFVLYNSSGIVGAVETCITGLTPNLSYIKNTEKILLDNFELETNAKYSNYHVVEIEKGIKHIKMTKYYNKRPVNINIVELSEFANNNLKIEPVIADTTLSNKKKINNFTLNSIVAINGGYFKPQTGVPLGTLMINKKLFTSPIYDRVAIGFFDDGYDIARISMNSNLVTKYGGFKIDNINQPRMLSTHTNVYTKEWGKYSPISPKHGSQIVVENNRIVKYSVESQLIPEEGFVVVGPDKVISNIAKSKRVKLDIGLSPKWNNVNHIISGGPYLVKNNEIFVDTKEQRLQSIAGRNPRTAIGYTKDNHLVLVVVDGREGASVGLTLNELANLMKEFGCINAINLDGGGSTVMSIKNKVVNKPVLKDGIPLSHALIVKKVN